MSVAWRSLVLIGVAVAVGATVPALRSSLPAAARFGLIAGLILIAIYGVQLQANYRLSIEQDRIDLESGFGHRELDSGEIESYRIVAGSYWSSLVLRVKNKRRRFVVPLLFGDPPALRSWLGTIPNEDHPEEFFRNL